MTTAALTTPKILVLNKAYQPVGIANIERAFGLLVTGAAKALDKNYQVFDYDSWSELSAETGDDVIHTVRQALKVPRVLVLQVYDRLPRSTLRFSRNNIYLRDKFTCAYCKVKFSRSQLNLDHVVPKSQGGKTCWENVTTSCVKCNLKKGARTPQEAGWSAVKPAKPTWSQLMPRKADDEAPPYEEWLPFLDPASASYWNAELQE